MVTHDPHAAERAQRILHLEKGRLVDDVQKAVPSLNGEVAPTALVR
jgi:ABC-type lipoprotein export system ATPase subunit